jgi:hypothetical protein
LSKEIRKPRIGDVVFLGKKKAKVIGVMLARDVLDGMTDAEARLFGDSQRSILGHDWIKNFYRVTIKFSDSEWSTKVVNWSLLNTKESGSENQL